MPTILLLYGFRFFFYSNEGNEPAHIHITKGDAFGKVWLLPDVAVAYFHGFSVAEQKQVMQIVEQHLEVFKDKWNEYFK